MIEANYSSPISQADPRQRPSAHAQPEQRQAQPHPDPAQAGQVAAAVSAPQLISVHNLIQLQETKPTDFPRRDEVVSRQTDHQNHPATQDAGNGGAEKSATQPGELTAEEQQTVNQLKQADAEVRAHELAHRAAGGSLTGPARFTYATGPDGRQYAVAGEVSIDTGTEATPQATIAKMEQVIRAALAPANPSSQDLAVAQAARQALAQAQSEQREEQADQNDPASATPGSTNPFAIADHKRGIEAYMDAGAAFGSPYQQQQASDPSAIQGGQAPLALNLFA